MKRAAPLVLVFLLFHSPDGGPLWIACQAIFAVRPIGGAKQHVASGTRALIYMPGHTLAIKEAPEDTAARVDKCRSEGD